eukprot:2456696-Prymnesium_polylepis.1
MASVAAEASSSTLEVHQRPKASGDSRAQLARAHLALMAAALIYAGFNLIMHAAFAEAHVQ